MTIQRESPWPERRAPPTLVDAGGARRTQLIEMTIDSLAEVGYVEST